MTCDELVKLDTEDLQTRLEDWVMSMRELGLRRSSIRTPLAAVEKFLDVNRKLYYKKVLHSLLTADKDLEGGHEPFTNADVQKMLKGTNKLRTKALVLFLASTGARPQALVDPVLRRKHLVDMPDGCYAVKIYDNSKEGYWAFLTPEAKIELDEYLKNRKLNGELITDESPLFANFAKHAKSPYLTVENMYDMLSDLYKMSGIERQKVGNRYNKALVYGFRKRFNTILKINSAVNSNIAEKLMAHKRGLDGSYLKPTREECFTEFAKAIPNLTIDDKERDKLKIRKLESEKSELEKGKLEIEQMKKRIEELEFGAEARKGDYAKNMLKFKREKNRSGEVFSMLWHNMIEMMGTEEEKRQFLKKLNKAKESGEKIDKVWLCNALGLKLEDYEIKNQYSISQMNMTGKEMEQFWKRVKKAREGGEKRTIEWLCDALNSK